MNSIQKMAAICVLLFGFAQAQKDASGDFTFTVEQAWEMSCKNAKEYVIAGLDVTPGIIITSPSAAISSPAEIVCNITANLSSWDVLISAANGGKFKTEDDETLTTGTSKDAKDDANLAIYATLALYAEDAIMLVDSDDDAKSVEGLAAPKEINNFVQFSLADMFDGHHFASDGTAGIILTIKGAVLSQNTSTKIISDPGTYVETLNFEFKEVPL